MKKLKNNKWEKQNAIALVFEKKSSVIMREKWSTEFYGAGSRTKPALHRNGELLSVN